MLKLKLQYFGHLLQTAESLEKNPDAGKDRWQEERGATEDEMVVYTHTHTFFSLIGYYRVWNIVFCAIQ